MRRKQAADGPAAGEWAARTPPCLVTARAQRESLPASKAGAAPQAGASAAIACRAFGPWSCAANGCPRSRSSLASIPPRAPPRASPRAYASPHLDPAPECRLSCPLAILRGRKTRESCRKSGGFHQTSALRAAFREAAWERKMKNRRSKPCVCSLGIAPCRPRNAILMKTTRFPACRGGQIELPPGGCWIACCAVPTRSARPAPPRLGKSDMSMDMPSLEAVLGPIPGSVSRHLYVSSAVSGPDTSAAVHLRL